MYEIGLLVETDTASLHRKRCVPEFFDRDVFEPHVYCGAEQVLAVPGNTAARRAQHFIRFWRAVRGDNLVGPVAPESFPDVINQIEQAGVHGGHVAGSKISKVTIDFLEGWLDVLAVLEIDDIQPFVGMRVVERQMFCIEGTSVAQVHCRCRQTNRNQADKNC